jgi:hypothetical protein
MPNNLNKGWKEMPERIERIEAERLHIPDRVAPSPAPEARGSHAWAAVRCVECAHYRDFRGGPAEYLPMCPRCGSPMVSVRAEVT